MPFDAERYDLIAGFLGKPEHATMSDSEVAAQLKVPAHAVGRVRRNLGKPKTMDIALNAIKVDPALQLRVDLDRLKVQEHVERLDDGHTHHPVVVFTQDDKSYLLADGFQRYAASSQHGDETIPADVRRGDFRDALLYACGANGNHGLNLTARDRRNAIRTLLNDPAWTKLSNREIAHICHVTHPTVASVRKEWDAEQVTPIATSKPKIAPVAVVPAVQVIGEPQPKAPVAVSDSEPELNNQPLPAADSTEPSSDPVADPRTLKVERQTDEEYLESLPLRQRLKPNCRDRFDADAILYRNVTHSEAYRSFVQMLAKHAPQRDASTLGRYGKDLFRVKLTRPPASWIICGNCDGSGFHGTDRCPICVGCGYKAG